MGAKDALAYYLSGTAANARPIPEEPAFVAGLYGHWRTRLHVANRVGGEVLREGDEASATGT